MWAEILSDNSLEPIIFKPLGYFRGCYREQIQKLSRNAAEHNEIIRKPNK